MQLDKTEIVIRSRSLLELLDLTLRVIQQYWWQLLSASALLSLPLLALDVMLIGWMLGEQGRFAMADLEQPDWAVQNRYLLHLFALWFLQFPLASLPATVLIGNQIFFERLTWKRLWKMLRPILWRSFLVMGILRFGLVAMLLEPFISRDEPFDPFIEIVLLLLVCCGWAMIRRASAPYAPEILGLESCRLKARQPNELSYWRRSSGLHSPIVGDCIGRFLTCAIVVSLLVGMLYSFTLVIDFVGARKGQGAAVARAISSLLSNATMLMLVLPIILWLASMYATVFRFLTYLDSRIRLEGWEVELQLKAERGRLMQTMNITPEGHRLELEVPAS